MKKRGCFITLEGGDGSGKTTVMKGLENYFLKQGVEILTTREPGGTEIGELVRELVLSNKYKEMIPETEALLYAASRAQHVGEKIQPALEKGTTVLCDRYVLSSIAYQGYGRKLGAKEVKMINDFATNQLEPDVVLFLHMDWKETLLRKTSIGGDRLENSGSEFHHRVHLGYEEIMKTTKNLEIIDASKTQEEVLEQCIAVLKKRRVL